MRRRALLLPVVLSLSLLPGSPAQAGATPVSSAKVVVKAQKTSIKGKYGQVLTVTKAKGLKSRGERVTIAGNRFDETVGIYVALCVVPKRGQQPSPCGGGVDQSGGTGASKWISSNPPPYGSALAIPFQPGGRFSVGLKVGSRIGAVDCRKVKCAIVVRADHMRSEDRTHDLFIPVTFAKK
jgi:hypothetical protein